MPSASSFAGQVLQELGTTGPHAVSVVISGVGIYLAFLLFIRIFGQRVLTAMSTFDVVVTVMLGAVAGRVILGDPPSLANGVLGLATLFILEAVFGQLRSYFHFHRMLNSPPRLLMAGAEVLDRNLKRAHITRSELDGALRRAGIRSYGEVACVLHEPGGQVSVLRRGVPVDPQLLVGVREADLIPSHLMGRDWPPGGSTAGTADDEQRPSRSAHED